MNPEFNDEFHIEIAPVKDGISRLTWSVVIPTFNCANYLRQTLQSVLKQNYPPDQMEIIVVDDCSIKDDPKSVVDEFERGRIKFFQQKKNVGKSANYTTGIAMATGQYIHLLHGDDTVTDGFFDKMDTLFNDYPNASVAFCRCNYINAKDEIIGETKLISKSEAILENFPSKIATWQLIQPPSIIFKRIVYETLGTYDLRLKYIEDWEFYVRASLYFDFAYTPEKLANYRIFSENSSSQSIKGGKRLATLEQVIAIMDGYLPTKIREGIKKKRSRAVALYLINFIPFLVKHRDYIGFFKTTITFAKYNNSLRLWGRWLRFIFQYEKFR